MSTSGINTNESNIITIAGIRTPDTYRTENYFYAGNIYRKANPGTDRINYTTVPNDSEITKDVVLAITKVGSTRMADHNGTLIPS